MSEPTEQELRDLRIGTFSAEDHRVAELEEAFIWLDHYDVTIRVMHLYQRPRASLIFETRTPFRWSHREFLEIGVTPFEDCLIAAARAWLEWNTPRLKHFDNPLDFAEMESVTRTAAQAEEREEKS